MGNGLHDRSPSDDNGEMDEDEALDEAGTGMASDAMQHDSPVRKRRRSRKGLDKRFECTAEGCGKSYSRAEHLWVT
jgi:hypothetical protein